ncbi:helix-turn-helix transcriptional regulator [Legionella jamestowniensis]|uniref:DNA-binding protein n=1 Tax=Legionella jamestowniensis TaxID=455 RepID=A0A0W0UK96_9GAMM|nr:YafY family protein [Legionella jamestowniensis]KTD08312.1 transcriptional regulator [Legionella jamestowniensis]OCH97161.1 DNA-binding protein [Legionella jamestowniensis]SFL49590.1 Predicted DNA-binding transcriptional regulator YafY, contains an HTH and WYL domains [Legionella jamestowniensis DSM 19215]
MSRTQRLFELLQLLRQHRYPVSGKILAEKLEVSLRTLYRDIATLQLQGANIEGEPGLGYVLRPGFTLPPLMFSEEEIEALVLGSRWVARRADEKLKKAAIRALSKISAVLPTDLRHQLESSGLLIGPTKSLPINEQYEALIRHAIRKEYKLQINYTDVNEKESRRIIWPLALGFFEETRMIVAWCELRNDFRHFRTDRINNLSLLENFSHKKRQTLLKQWREIYNIPEQ